MKIILPFFLIMLLTGNQIPVSAQNSYSSFEKINAKSISANTIYATVVYFYGTINSERVLLNWTLDKNQVVDQIEVERSKDGKNFVMAGLVFGTDQPDKADYTFYEKNKKINSFYRLKIIHKDQTIDYSAVISPEPVPATN
jgi:hypothetical protein